MYMCCLPLYGFVHILGPCGSLQRTLLWGWEFPLLPPQPPEVFSLRSLRLYFPALEPWGCAVCHLVHQLQLCLPHSTIRRLARSSSHCLAESPLCPGCPSLPLLPGMNVSSLTPWLLDFHTIWFSVSSGCFLFLNCCPSFGCSRRHSESTYTTILAGSLWIALHFFTAICTLMC